MTLLEKIIALHSGKETVSPGEIVDVEIDMRVARDFGGANVVKHIKDSGLIIDDPGKTLFTFDCNPTGSDQKYTVNQHICRLFARENGVKVYDIDAGIGTHLLIDKGIVPPGQTALSTDSHANILGAIGAFGQGMGDMDIAAAWLKGKIWFRVPPSIIINLNGVIPPKLDAKDIALNLLKQFGANSLLGYSIEMGGSVSERLSLDDRITISSMATEMGAIIILFPPSKSIIDYCSKASGKKFEPVYADKDAHYEKTFDIDVSGFSQLVSRPGEPHDAVPLKEVSGTKIDSAFVGSCTNGRLTDMRIIASILKNRKVAPGVVLKIVPATNEIWNKCLSEGLIKIFKKAGAMVSNAGCAGCAAGQVGQNGQGEVTISSGNRNFPGKQGKGSVYLASPAVVASSAVAGYITDADNIPEKPAVFSSRPLTIVPQTSVNAGSRRTHEQFIEGHIRLISRDNIDTDMIFHNRYLTITDINEMGKFTFDNLKGYESFSSKVRKGDILVAGKNFGCGSSRQQAVDCFVSLGMSGILAESFGAIYERNAINAAFPIMTITPDIVKDLNEGDLVRIDLKTGYIINKSTGRNYHSQPFSDVQYNIYQRGGLLV
ncbi:MAG TPA: aconitase/3-isopropylmalate dehydratase large subunit family protein [Bacteroidales bacterium]|nr:aconitase/3-isopropylmalate dehydratase large subunit family protein [Bacteroidales bacterium]